MNEFIEYIPKGKTKETKGKKQTVGHRNQHNIRNRNSVPKQTKRWIVLKDGKLCNIVPMSFNDAEAFANFIMTKNPTSIVQIKPRTTLPENLQRRIVPV